MAKKKEEPAASKAARLKRDEEAAAERETMRERIAARRKEKQEQRANRIFTGFIKSEGQKAIDEGETDASKIADQVEARGRKRFGSMWVIFGPILRTLIETWVKRLLERFNAEKAAAEKAKPAD